MSAGYNIPVSTSVSDASASNPFSDDETNFFFGSGDTSADSPSQSPSTSATASTAASEQGNASSTAASATGTGSTLPLSTTGTNNSGPSLSTYLLYAAIALVVWHFVLKKPL